MKHVIFIKKEKIVEVWENVKNVAIDGDLINADGEIILGFPGEVIVIDATIDYKNKTIDELRELNGQEPEQEDLQEKIIDLEQKVAQLEEMIQQIITANSGTGGDSNGVEP